MLQYPLFFNIPGSSPPAGGGRAVRSIMDNTYFWVYAVYNFKHKRLYIGQTQDIHERLKHHNEKKFSGSYTSRFDGEWTLIFSEKCESRYDALGRERQLKSYQGREFIKKYINNPR